MTTIEEIDTLLERTSSIRKRTLNNETKYQYLDIDYQWSAWLSLDELEQCLPLEHINLC